MDGYEFQKFVANLFKKLGFANIRLGPQTADGGIDISMEQKTDIGSILYTVECKHHPKSSIGRPVVQKLHSACMHRPMLDKGIIVTTGRFSGPAIKYAEEVGIELIDIEKLKELAQKVGLSLKVKPSLSVDNCFPISDKDEVVNRLFSFLGSDLIGFNKDLVEIDGIGLKLHSSYMVDYSIDATFSTSVGMIHSINEESCLFLSGDSGNLINPIITNPFSPAINSISELTEDDLTGVELQEKGEFVKSHKEIKRTAIDLLRKLYTKNVSYYGANNVHYTKTCTPRKKDISITGTKRVYLPVWSFWFSLLQSKYLIVGTETQQEFNVFPSDIPVVPKSSDIKRYPSKCMMCSRELKDEKYFCNECGIIICEKDISTCKICGKVICKEHTVSKRKFLILSDKYCPQCAKSEGIVA